MTDGIAAESFQQAAAEDRRLLQAHVDGDPRAFEALVLRHRHRLWAVALRTTGDREEAADALQDGLISAFRNAHTYRGEAAVTTWMHRIVVNACLDRLRRRQARPSVPLGDTDVAWTRDEHRSAEQRIDLEAALATLPAPQRAAIVLVDMHDVPVIEAAAILGVAEGTIKSRCSRARTALARVLRADAAPVAPAPVSPAVGNRTAVPPVTAATALPSRRSRRESVDGSTQENTW